MASSRVIRLAVIGLAFLAFTAAPAQAELILTSGNNVVFVNDNGTFNHQISVGSAAQGVVANPNATFYVANSGNQLIEFNAFGSTVIASTSGGAGALALNDPRGIARDLAGNVYVANFANDNVVRFNSALGGETEYGNLSLNFGRPTALVVDAAGNAFVTAINQVSGLGQLYRIDSLGNVTNLNADLTGTATVVTNQDLGVAFRPTNGDLLIAVNNTIREFTTAGVLVGTFASDTTAANNMVSPIGVGFGLDGNFYVANTSGSGTNGNNILQFPPGGGSNNASNFFQVTGPRFITFASPEPASLTLVALGSAAGLLGYWRRRKAARLDGEPLPAPEEAPAA